MKKQLAIFKMKPARKIHSGGRAKLCFVSFFTFSFSFFTFLSGQNISTVAGNNTFGPGYSGDGSQATSAGLNGPYAVAFDGSGNMYIADDVNNVIRKVDHSTGNISTVVGNMISGGAAGGGFSGDGGPATAAEIRGPASIVFDAFNNMIIADADNHVIRKVDHSTGIISTVAGNHVNGYNGDGGQATAAELSYPTGIALDPSGNIYIAEHGNNVIREVGTGNGSISTIAGNHVSGYFGDGGPATAAELSAPATVVVSRSYNIFIADYNNNVIREVQSGTGTISTFAGIHVQGYSGDGGLANAAELANPWGITTDGPGNFFIADEFNNVIRKIDFSNGTISTIAGNYVEGLGYSGDGGPATIAELYAPVGVALDGAGNLYIADNQNNVIREVNSVTIGIDEISTANDEVSIYPNPNNGRFIVALNYNGPQLAYQTSQTKMEVYNVYGEKVYSAFLPQTSKGALNEINLSNLSNGVYFIRIANQDGNITKRVVIEK